LGSGSTKPDTNAPGCHLKVLIVDDHSASRHIIKHVLKPMPNFKTIRETNTGENAWELIQSDFFDLVICDSTLVDTSGLVLLKRCRRSEEHRFLPFIMTGPGTDWPAMASAIGEWEAYDYLIRPFSIATLESGIRRVLERINSPEELLYRQIRLLKDKGEAGEALNIINREELQKRLGMARWINLKGECLASSGESEAAIGDFHRAIEACGVFISAYKNCADANIELGNIDDAITLLKTAERISPVDDERSFKLGELLLDGGQSDECRKHFEELRKRHRSQDDKLNFDKKLAQFFMQNDLNSDAEEIYKYILDEHSNIDDYNRLGIVYRKQGKYREAEQCYYRALKQYPDNPTICYNLAVLYFARHDRFAAKKYVLKALAHDPSYEQALQLLGRIEKGSPDS
jgi:tetratricopeptide (TPR) repeat protein